MKNEAANLARIEMLAVNNKARVQAVIGRLFILQNILAGKLDDEKDRNYLVKFAAELADDALAIQRACNAQIDTITEGLNYQTDLVAL